MSSQILAFFRHYRLQAEGFNAPQSKQIILKLENFDHFSLKENKLNKQQIKKSQKN